MSEATLFQKSQWFSSCSWASVFAQPFENRPAQNLKDCDINRIVFKSLTQFHQMSWKISQPPALLIEISSDKEG